MILFPFIFSFYIFSFIFHSCTAFFKLLNIFIFHFLHITFFQTFFCLFVYLSSFPWTIMCTPLYSHWHFSRFPVLLSLSVLASVLFRHVCLVVCVYMDVSMSAWDFLFLFEWSFLFEWYFPLYVIIKVDFRLSLLFQI